MNAFAPVDAYTAMHDTLFNECYNVLQRKMCDHFRNFHDRQIHVQRKFRGNFIMRQAKKELFIRIWDLQVRKLQQQFNAKRDKNLEKFIIAIAMI